MGSKGSGDDATGMSLAFVRNILDTLPNPCCVIDTDGNYVYANNSISKFLGYAPEEIMRMHTDELFTPEQAAGFKLIQNQVLDTGERIRTTQKMHSNSTGKDGIVELRFDRITDAAGKPYIRVIVTDITEANERLKEQNRRIELLNESIDSMAQGLIVFGPEEIEFVSCQANELLEVGEEILAPGKPSEAYFRYLHKRGDLGAGREGERNLSSALRRLRFGGEKTIERHTPTGKVVQLNTQPRRTAGLPGNGMIVTVTDITRISELALELEAARRRFKAFAEANSDYFWEMNSDLQISYLSPAFEEITGIPCSAVVGMPRNIIKFEVNDPADLEEYQKAIAERRPFRDFTYCITRADGGKMWIAASGMPHIDSHGVFLGFIGNGRDVTVHVNRQQELVEARQQAQMADHAKSEFLANMSHEIRTPMNGVMGMAELLAKTDLDARQKTFTDIILKSGTSLLGIINDILDFSKIDAGQMGLDPAPFNLTEAVEDVATLVAPRVAEKKLELIVRVDPDMPEMLIGDTGRIRQIITNLVGNAVKFTETGYVYVNVKGTPVSNGNYEVRFEVHDTGIGIPEDKQARIFEKFSQVDTSSSRKHEGTGLGLAIASSLVKLMGGYMGIESEASKGSTFWFEISLPVSEHRNLRRKAPMDVSGSRIIVVDDNPVNREILTEQMAAWKFDCAAADSGRSALALMRAAVSRGLEIDCIVLDYQMPDMNGSQVVDEMRSDPALAGIPVIMLTSVDQTEEGRRFSSLGIEAHLVKPARSSLLLETIISVIGNYGKEAGMTADAPQAESEETDIPAAETPIDMKKAAISRRDIHEVADESQLDILVCEDNEVNRIVFSQILQALPYTFQIAENGRIGLEKYKQFLPKLILMDISMPEMNGLETTEAIRAIESRTGADTPIIGVTAHAIKGDREKCLSSGMDDYLSKPVSPNALEEKVKNWLEGRETSQRIH